MKYHQSYPHRRFRDLLSVRAWVDGFVDWYNNEHRHSGIQYVMPNQRHYGQAEEICTRRQQTYEKARELNPRRWSRHPRNWSQLQTVQIYHPRAKKMFLNDDQIFRLQEGEVGPPARGGLGSPSAREPAAQSSDDESNIL